MGKGKDSGAREALEINKAPLVSREEIDIFNTFRFNQVWTKNLSDGTSREITVVQAGSSPYEKAGLICKDQYGPTVIEPALLLRDYTLTKDSDQPLDNKAPATIPMPPDAYQKKPKKTTKAAEKAQGPASPAQASYLKRLYRMVGEEPKTGLTKAQASKEINRLKTLAGE